jgi:hypothetical protein
MGNLLRIVVLPLCVCLWGCETTDPAHDKGDATRGGIAYVHRYSKFSFPRQIGKFHYIGAHEFDPAGKDISVGYNSPTPVAATVYVYPAPENVSLLPAPRLQNVSNALLDREFQLHKLAITRAHSDARLVSEGPCEIVQGKNYFQGKKAVYSLAYRFGVSNQDCLSELYLFLIEPGVMFLANDRQYVEYRITYPAAAQDRATNEINSFLSSLSWPVK